MLNHRQSMDKYKNNIDIENFKQEDIKLQNDELSDIPWYNPLQLTQNISIRWWRWLWLLDQNPVRGKHGDYYFNTVTRKFIVYDSRSNERIGDIRYCVGYYTWPVPNTTYQQLDIDGFNENYAMWSTWQIEILENWPYIIYWIVQFASWIGDREIYIKRNGNPIFFDRTEWDLTISKSPVTYPVVWWAGWSVTVQEAFVANDPQIKTLQWMAEFQLLDVWDIITIEWRQNSWWPLVVTSYLQVIKI
jgi:hypothetical protein